MGLEEIFRVVAQPGGQDGGDGPGTDRWAEDSEDREPPTQMPQGTPVGTWAPGPQLLAVRAQYYSMSTCDVAVLPEAGLVPEKGLAQSLSEWEPLTLAVTTSVLQVEALRTAQSPCPLAT